jgi:hypothetical protein
MATKSLSKKKKLILVATKLSLVVYRGTIWWPLGFQTKKEKHNLMAIRLSIAILRGTTQWHQIIPRNLGSNIFIYLFA